VGTVIETSVPPDDETAIGVVHAAPNPFEGRTTLSFTLAAAGPVRVRVHDLSGRLVCTLLDEPLGPGDHTAVWDGADGEGRPSASGIYFALVEAPGVRCARKLVLLR
jgi:hypothetical protein